MRLGLGMRLGGLATAEHLYTFLLTHRFYTAKIQFLKTCLDSGGK